ncbi:diguanylate cyclase [Candidatus Fermentibacteria bacterium]|nr:diguanylate cyclase [Candidatus Fermentibacteria bacterium]
MRPYWAPEDSLLIRAVSDGVCVMDRSMRIVAWNRSAERISGYSEEEALGSVCCEGLFMHADDSGRLLCGSDCPVEKSVRANRSIRRKVTLLHKDGYRVPVRLTVLPVGPDEAGQGGALEVFTERISRRQLEDRVRNLESVALVDHLTTVPNRRYLQTQVETAVQERERYRIEIGVLFMDVDGFKEINDRHGHSGGDAVLETVAKTLVASSRPADVFGRWGGDEFLGIVRFADRDILEKIGTRCRSLVGSSVVRRGGLSLGVTLSVGGTLITDRDDAQSVVRRADGLMYASKGRGGDLITIG